MQLYCSEQLTVFHPTPVPLIVLSFGGHCLHAVRPILPKTLSRGARRQVLLAIPTNNAPRLGFVVRFGPLLSTRPQRPSPFRQRSLALRPSPKLRACSEVRLVARSPAVARRDFLIATLPRAAGPPPWDQYDKRADTVARAHTPSPLLSGASYEDGLVDARRVHPGPVVAALVAARGHSPSQTLRGLSELRQK